ncbi:MAG: 2-hydroxyacyl-CoA dehydratase family protein [Deltaproteobacteria bacterium]|nr:2-hydroxyacyl-CoA dehydratase family protein [Deltaproteobacteria bacterium]
MDLLSEPLTGNNSPEKTRMVTTDLDDPAQGQIDPRTARLRSRARERIDQEKKNELLGLTQRADYSRELDYFINLLNQDLSPKALSLRLERQVVALMCLQVPLEFFLALELQPLRLYGGSLSAAKSAPPGLPALMCPLLRSLMGELIKDPSLAQLDWLVPTTCDWVSGFENLRSLFIKESGRVRLIELPRRKEHPWASEHWLSEVAGLWEYLKKIAGRKAGRKDLIKAIETMERARTALAALTALRRQGKVPAVYFFLITFSFFFDTVPNWILATEKAVNYFNTLNSGQDNGHTGLFLTGSPVIFPNFKILHLFDELGLKILGDDMCSGERLLFRHVAIKDHSEEGLLRALAETSHDGCLCPVFVENRRRLGPILEAKGEAEFKGVVFHLLKGCHPYEMDSLALERDLAENNLRFIRLETDYTPEDSGNLLTRLEAFKSTL